MRPSKLLLLALLVASPALAQIEISVQLPTITFNAPPPLVVVQPGVQVVEDHDDEIFFVDSFYWVRRGPRWYRTRDYRGGWVVVEGARVPPTLVRLPPGQYRHFKHLEKREKKAKKHRD
jgi:hypothetical protein